MLFFVGVLVVFVDSALYGGIPSFIIKIKDPGSTDRMHAVICIFFPVSL